MGCVWSVECVWSVCRVWSVCGVWRSVEHVWSVERGACVECGLTWIKCEVHVEYLWSEECESV